MLRRCAFPDGRFVMRTSVLHVVSAVLFLSMCVPAEAQPQMETSDRWDVGSTVQAVFMDGISTATGIGVNVSWWESGAWGGRIGLRRDAAVQRDLRRAYEGATSWADQRRYNVTTAVVWRPVRSDGAVHQTLQVSAGPTLQVRRGERPRIIGAVDQGLTIRRILADPGVAADNAYLDRSQSTPLFLTTWDTNQTNVGLTIGLRYGLTYKSVTVEGLVTGRKVTNIDGVTVGAGGAFRVSL